MKKTKMKPISILRKVFGQKPDQSLVKFKAECDEVKAHDNYDEFINECAAFIDVDVDHS